LKDVCERPTLCNSGDPQREEAEIARSHHHWSAPVITKPVEVSSHAARVNRCLREPSGAQARRTLPFEDELVSSARYKKRPPAH